MEVKGGYNHVNFEKRHYNRNRENGNFKVLDLLAATDIVPLLNLKIHGYRTTLFTDTVPLKLTPHPFRKLLATNALI